MKIVFEKTYNGVSIKGEAVMLSRHGDVLNVIDDKYHPNPGPREEEYPEIERCIDWLLYNRFSEVRFCIDEWMRLKISYELERDVTDIKEILSNVMFTDLYTPSCETIDAIKKNYEYLQNNLSEVDDYLRINELTITDEIVKFINEKFLRVRIGGKLNPSGEDAIYFRISSHGFDWHSVIVNFLWDMFDSPDKMPKKIWIGHDAENNPPEVTLFEGTPKELLENEDSKLFENLFI